MRTYTEITDDAVITLESSRNAVFQGVYWLITAAIALFDGSYVGTDPPLQLVVWERQSNKAVYRKGPFHGAEAAAQAEEGSRVIRVLGIKAYIDREAT